MTENLIRYARNAYRESHRGPTDGYDRVFFVKAVLSPAGLGVASLVVGVLEDTGVACGDAMGGAVEHDDGALGVGWAGFGGAEVAGYADVELGVVASGGRITVEGGQALPAGLDVAAGWTSPGPPVTARSWLRRGR
jgi:hypothetical protein